MRIKLDLPKIKIYLKRLPRILAEHAFLAFFGLFLLTLLLGGVLFYWFGFSVERMELETVKKQSQFNEAVFQKFLKEWQEREERFLEAETKTYADPFR
jgi:cytochrome b561